MASNFTYKKNTTTSMKLVGYLDTDRGVIDVDGDEKSLMVVLSDFNGAEVTINVKTSEDEELQEPEPVDDDEV